MKYPVINTRGAQTASGNLPEKKIHVVIDSDTYNEVDDQFAISICNAFTRKKYRWKQSMQPLFPQISLLG